MPLIPLGHNNLFVWFQNRRAKEKRLKKDAGRRWTTDTLASSSFNKTFDSDSGSNDDLGSLNGRSPLYSSGHPFSDTPTELEIHADLNNGGSGGCGGGGVGTYQMPGSYMNGLDQQQQQQQQVSQGLLAMQQSLNQQQQQQQQQLPTHLGGVGGGQSNHFMTSQISDQSLTNPYDLSNAAGICTPLTPSQQQALSHMGMLHSQHFSHLPPQQQPPQSMHHPYSLPPHHQHHHMSTSSTSAQHSPLSLSSYVPHLQGLPQMGHMSPSSQPMSHTPLSMQPMSVGGSYHH
uniref:Homeobox domain-containing protein n=1 Tax=Panagrolaimus superbus TaxID=310955 RepID=A0A914YUS7_9BILA